jgi:hypothetical protein
MNKPALEKSVHAKRNPPPAKVGFAPASGKDSIRRTLVGGSDESRWSHALDA